MVNITRYAPIGDIFDDLMKGYFVRPAAPAEAAETVRQMRIDVAERDNAYTVLAEVPGVKKDNIQIDIEGDVVSITAEIRAEKDVKEGERVIHSERYFGKLARSFRLGQEIDQANAIAKYSDGVLELVLPKKITAAAKRVTIQ